MFGTVSLLRSTAAEAIYTKAEQILCHEYAISSLIEYGASTALIELLAGESMRRFFRTAPVDRCLDVIQVTLVVAKDVFEKGGFTPLTDAMTLDEGIAELNARFREHRVGYQFHEGQILKLDSEFSHQMATLPALLLLRQPYLAGADQEFRAAHDHFRHGRYKDALNDCLKAFESTMKAICHKRRWAYSQGDTAKVLIKICEQNKLFPVFMDSHLTGLRTTLEGGVPTARNKLSGHGQGAVPITVSEEFASYVLNLAAANILFLARSEQKLK